MSLTVTLSPPLPITLTLYLIHAPVQFGPDSYASLSCVPSLFGRRGSQGGGRANVHFRAGCEGERAGRQTARPAEQAEAGGTEISRWLGRACSQELFRRPTSTRVANQAVALPTNQPDA
jgi:hypothetical protein